MPTSDLSPSQLNRVLLDQIADKWSILILTVLCDGCGKARFNEIKRAVVGIPQKSLAQALRRLERNGLVQRHVLPTKPPGVEYEITELGHSLEKPFAALQGWAEVYYTKVAAAQARFDLNDEGGNSRNLDGLIEKFG